MRCAALRHMYCAPRSMHSTHYRNCNIIVLKYNYTSMTCPLKTAIALLLQHHLFRNTELEEGAQYIKPCIMWNSISEVYQRLRKCYVSRQNQYALLSSLVCCGIKTKIMSPTEFNNRAISLAHELKEKQKEVLLRRVWTFSKILHTGEQGAGNHFSIFISYTC